MATATVSTSPFMQSLQLCADDVAKFLLSSGYLDRFHPADLRDAVRLYVQSGGKRLRPAILTWSCGATGGDPALALPAAAAVELFHTWTLVHDDIIDRDDRRRGSLTVHEFFRRRAGEVYPQLSGTEQAHYGTSVAILSGDVQHGWGISILTELTRKYKVDPAITLHLIDRLDNHVLNLLVEGEILDIQFCHEPIQNLKLDDIEEMIWKKTGVLYNFCAEAGALIGLGTADENHPYVHALSQFSSQCGIAFQLQDDLLGAVGDPGTTGKPVGNDIREGKRTSLIHYAYTNADRDEQALIEQTLGNLEVSEEDLEKVIRILEKRGGIEQTRQRARYHIEQALPHLDTLPPGSYRDLLRSWAEFMISRND